MTKKSLKDKLDGNELDLSLLNLADVPVKDIAALPKATQIDLSNNQIANLPANFASSLKHITHLDLGSNKLKALPENIGLLENLTHLDLYNNQLTDLPVTFCQLRKLKWLDLKGNKLNPVLRKVAGDCLNTKECEAAARNVIQHLKQRQIQIENERLQKIKKEQEMEARKKAEEERSKKQAEKKSMKEKKKNESVPAPKAKVEANGRAPAPKTAEPKPKKKEKKQRKAKKSSSLGWLNWFLMLCLMGALGGGVYIYTGGDFSEEGLNNAYAKLVENSHTLAEITAEAFQPDNLKETAQTVSKNIVECFAAAWAKLEEYTGDLSMYTTPVIEVTSEVLVWLKAKAIVCYEWLRDNVDWEYIFDTIKSGVKYLYDQCLHLCEELSKNETFMSGVQTMKMHAASALEFLGTLLASLWKQIIIALQYIQDEGPGILSAMKEQASGALHAAKQSFEGLIK